MYILRWNSASQQHEGIRDRPLFVYLTIIPRAQMGSESTAHEAEGRIEWAIDSEVMRARGIIVLVKSK